VKSVSNIFEFNYSEVIKNQHNGYLQTKTTLK